MKNGIKCQRETAARAKCVEGKITSELKYSSIHNKRQKVQRNLRSFEAEKSSGERFKSDRKVPNQKKAA